MPSYLTCISSPREMLLRAAGDHKPDTVGVLHSRDHHKEVACDHQARGHKACLSRVHHVPPLMPQD